MRERIEAYQELKYTALNCGIETTDIAIIVEYILANLEEKRALRATLVEKKSRVSAVSVIHQLSQTNPKALKILETQIHEFVSKKEMEAQAKYDIFLKTLNTDTESQELLRRFIHDTSTKLLIIPFIPKFEELSCVALVHQDVAREYSIIERIAKVMKMFRENAKVFYATHGRFTIKADTPLIRSQIEQEGISTIQ